MRLSHTVHSFTGGEWSPSLYARADLGRYNTATRKMLNVIVHPYGGFSNRPGLEYVDALPNSQTEAKLVPFRFNVEQNYVLVLTHNRIDYLVRSESGAWGFIEDTGYGVAYSSTNYTEDDLADVDWAQSADVLYLFHPTKGTTLVRREDNPHYPSSSTVQYRFTVGRLGKETSGGYYTSRFGPELLPPENVKGIISSDNRFQSLCVSGIYEWKSYAGNLWAVESAGGGDPEIYDVGTGYGIYEDYHTTSPLHRDGPTYYVSDLDTLQAGATWGEWYFGEGKGHHFKTLWVKHSGNPGDNESNIVAVCKGYEYCVTVVSDSGEESTPSETAESGQFGKIEWDGVTGASHYNIYQRIKGQDDEWGWVGRVDGDTTEFACTGRERDKEKGPPELQPDFGFTSGATNAYINASHGAFFEQRLVLGNIRSSDADYDLPQTLFGSVTGFDRNFTVQSPIAADDTFQFALSSTTLNEIKWLRAMGGLVIGTTGGEWLVSGDGETGAVTPSTVNVRKYSDWGSSDVPPVEVGSEIVFVQNDGKHIRAFAVDHQNAVRGSDLTLFARHLFEDVTISRLAYQKYPDGVVWVVTEGGGLRSLTYDAEHSVGAWCRHSTYTGEFKDVVSVPRVTTGADDVLFVVKRGTDYQIEVLSDRFRDLDYFSRTVERGFFLDGALYYAPADAASGFSGYNPESISIAGDNKTVSGLTRFASETVQACVDGKYESVSVDASGGAVLENEVTISLAVGYSYTWEVETLDPVFVDPHITSMNRPVSISDVVVYYQDTAEIWVRDATDTSASFPARLRLSSDASYGSGEMSTGRTMPTHISKMSRDAPRIVLYGSKPVPATVNSVVYGVDVGE